MSGLLKVRMFRWDVLALPEYSASIPTGTHLWKTWRRRSLGGWCIGQYVPDSKPGCVGIRWREVEFLAGPRPTTAWP